MRKKSLELMSIMTIVVFLIPQKVYSIYTGERGRPEPKYASTRLIVKLKPEADKKINLGKVQGKIVTTGLAPLDSLNLKFKVKKQEKLFNEFKQTD